MTISELQILLDINKGNECTVLEEHACLTDHGYFFVDSEDGQCWLFDRNRKLDNVNKFKALLNGYVKKDIKKIVIPKHVKYIGGWTFESCASLKSIKIPNSVKSIGTWAYYGCKSLKSIKIPDSVKSIGEGVFLDCTSLASIEIPNSIKSIGYGAFENCRSLKDVVFKDKTINQVKAMDEYPWGIEDEAIIKCS